MVAVLNKHQPQSKWQCIPVQRAVQLATVGRGNTQHSCKTLQADVGPSRRMPDPLREMLIENVGFWLTATEHAPGHTGGQNLCGATTCHCLVS